MFDTAQLEDFLDLTVDVRPHFRIFAEQFCAMRSVRETLCQIYPGLVENLMGSLGAFHRDNSLLCNFNPFLSWHYREYV